MALELRLQLVEHLRMRAGIDLALEDLLRAAHGERGHLLAQLLARGLHFLLDLRARGGEDAIALRLGGALGVLDAFVRALLGRGYQLLRALASLAQDDVRLLLRLG